MQKEGDPHYDTECGCVKIHGTTVEMRGIMKKLRRSEIELHVLRTNRRLFERHSRIAGNSVYDRSGQQMSRRRYQELSRLCLYAGIAALCGGGEPS